MVALTRGRTELRATSLSLLLGMLLQSSEADFCGRKGGQVKGRWIRSNRLYLIYFTRFLHCLARKV